MLDQEELKAIWDNPKLEKLLVEGIESDSGKEWNAEVLEKLKQQVLDRAVARES